jgi:glutathione S-transferase
MVERIKFSTVQEARWLEGVKLVAMRGFPSPWGEAAKGILHVKRIPYILVGLEGGGLNEDIQGWTGRNSSPILVYDQQQPLDRWSDILFMAERLEPEPRLVPSEVTDRALMFGLAFEILEFDGYLWNRRHWTLCQPEVAGLLPPENFQNMRAKYVIEHLRNPLARIKDVVQLLGKRLREQESRGSRYFIGRKLTALDIYCATAMALMAALPEPNCVLPHVVREWVFTERDPEVLAATDPILLAHRDYIYETYLELPLNL